MNKYGKVLRGLIALAVAVGLGTLIGWLVSRQGDVAPITVPAALITNQPLAVVPPMVQPPLPKPLPIIPDPALTQEGKQLAEGAPDWEEKLDDILLSDEDENGKADKI